jgi:hypothetical protein
MRLALNFFNSLMPLALSFCSPSNRLQRLSEQNTNVFWRFTRTRVSQKNIINNNLSINNWSQCCPSVCHRSSKRFVAIAPSWTSTSTVRYTAWFGMRYHFKGYNFYRFIFQPARFQIARLISTIRVWTLNFDFKLNVVSASVTFGCGQ